MISTIHIFALLIMCFTGLAASENPVIKNKCENFMKNSKAILQKRHSDTKCYASFGAAKWNLAKNHCEQIVPDGMKGQLIGVETGTRDANGKIIVNRNMEERVFRSLTRCTTELYWVKERQMLSTKPPFKVCELACTGPEPGPADWISANPYKACSTNEQRKFICEYELLNDKTAAGGIGLPIILVIVFGSIICVLAFVGILSLLVWYAKKRRLRAAAADQDTQTTSAASDYESPMKNLAPVMTDTDPQEQQPKTELSQCLTVGAGPEKTLQSEELSRTEKHKPRRPINHSYSTEKYFSWSGSKKLGTATKSDKKKMVSSGETNVDFKDQDNTNVLIQTKMTTPVKEQANLNNEIGPKDQKPNEAQIKMHGNKMSESSNVTEKEKQKIVTQENQQINTKIKTTIETGSNTHETKQPDKNALDPSTPTS